MKEMFKDIDIVIFDIMGVIIVNPSLVSEGLYPYYKGKYDCEYLESLYGRIRKNPAGDASLWNELGEKNPDLARKRFLDRFEIDKDFVRFKNLLKKNDFRIGILSNMPKEWGEYFSDKFDFEKDFNPIIMSGIVAMRKPDEEIYLEFEKRSGVSLRRSLFIDDKESNLKEASRFGAKTVLFSRARREEVKHGFYPDYDIASFEELS